MSQIHSTAEELLMNKFPMDTSPPDPEFDSNENDAWVGFLWGFPVAVIILGAVLRSFWGQL